MLTSEQLLEILRADMRLTISLRDALKHDRKERTRLYHDLVQETITLQHVIWLITDPLYAADIRENLLGGEHK